MMDRCLDTFGSSSPNEYADNRPNADHPQSVAQFVGHAGAQLAHGGQALGPQQAIMYSRQFAGPLLDAALQVTMSACNRSMSRRFSSRAATWLPMTKAISHSPLRTGGAPPPA